MPRNERHGSTRRSCNDYSIFYRIDVAQIVVINITHDARDYVPLLFLEGRQDNAVVESFFGGMKRELGDAVWETRQAARAAIFEYVEIWYNRQRRHSTLGYMTPEQYESSLKTAA